MSSKVQTVQTDTWQMRYMRFGKEGARPLVILPGLSVPFVTDAADAIRQAYQALAADYDIYLFDRRSTMPVGETYTIRMMAEETAQAMQILGIRKAGIFGVSQGGMIAQELAAGYPELVSAMVLGSSACRVHPGQEDLFEMWIRLAQEAAESGAASDTETLLDAFARAVYSPSVYEQVKGMIPAMAEPVTPGELERFVVLAEAVRGFDTRDLLSRIACPVLVIGAGRDQVLGSGAAPELAGLLHCDLYIYEESGHGVYDEAPDYVGRLKQFFDSI